MDRPLPVLEHFGELRKRILLSAALWMTATLASVPVTPHLLRALRHPGNLQLPKLVTFGPEEALLIYTRLSFSLGFVLSLPFILYQGWLFVQPAVSGRFQRLALWFSLAASFVFLLGGFFAYKVLLPAALHFLLSVGRQDIQPVISASRYVSFVIGVVLAGGVVFQMPLVAFFLSKCRLVNASFLRKKFKFAFVGILIAAGILTPTTDIFNMMILAIPMLVLYEVSVWAARLAQA